MNHRAGQIVLIGKLKSTSFGKVFSFFTIHSFVHGVNCDFQE